MRWGWMMVMLAVPSVAWAEYQVVPGQRIDLHELTRGFKQAVPEVAGCEDTCGTVTCRRQTGEFTEAERQAMDVVVAAHDPDVAAKRKAQTVRNRDSGDAKLRALGLTEDELQARRR